MGRGPRRIGKGRDAPHAHALTKAAHRWARRHAHQDATPLCGRLALGRADSVRLQQTCERRQQRRPFRCTVGKAPACGLVAAREREPPGANSGGGEAHWCASTRAKAAVRISSSSARLQPAPSSVAARSYGPDSWLRAPSILPGTHAHTPPPRSLAPARQRRGREGDTIKPRPNPRSNVSQVAAQLAVGVGGSYR